MIAGSTRGAGGPALARHLLSRKGGQEVRVLDARHLAAADLSGQLRELVAASRHGRTDRPVHHVHIDPPRGSDAESIMNFFVVAYEREFGLEDVQRCGVEHIKNGRPHYHLAYSLVRPNGKVADLSHEYARREKVSRITEFAFGLPWTKGKHNRAVAQALRKDGRADIADGMEAAGLLYGRRPVAVQMPRERAQAERTDIPVADVRRAALAGWQASDSGSAFERALSERGLRLAEGDRGPVLIDHAGGAHSLTRSLSASARSEGRRITAAEVRRRVANLTLNSIEEVKSNVRSAAESHAHDLRRVERRASNVEAAPSAPGLARGTGRERKPGRDQNLARDDRPDPRSTLAGLVGHQDRHRTRWAESDQVAARRLGLLDLGVLRAQADRIRLAPARQAVRDRAATRALSRIDVQEIREAALCIAAGGLHPHSQSGREGIAMKGIRGFRGFRPHKQDYKTRLLSEIVPGFDATAWADDLHSIDRDRPCPRIQLRDRSWVEIDPRAGVVKTWGRRGRAAVIGEAIAEAQAWRVEHLQPAGVIAASPERPAVRSSKTEIERWWRERGYDAIRAEDGIWIDIGPSARLQDTGDQVRLHGELTPEAARGLILKASEAWGGEAELQGTWSQSDQDALWLEAQRAGVHLGACEPSARARAAWKAETAEEVRRADTLGMVKAATGPARLLLDAAAGDASALTKLDPDLRAFVTSYLDDDQRAELAKADLTDVVPELHRFREFGAEERARSERDRDLKPVKVRDPIEMPPAPAPGF